MREDLKKTFEQLQRTLVSGVVYCHGDNSPATEAMVARLSEKGGYEAAPKRNTLQKLKFDRPHAAILINLPFIDVTHYANTILDDRVNMRKSRNLRLKNMMSMEMDEHITTLVLLGNFCWESIQNLAVSNPEKQVWCFVEGDKSYFSVASPSFFEDSTGIILNSFGVRSPYKPSIIPPSLCFVTCLGEFIDTKEKCLVIPHSQQKLSHKPRVVAAPEPSKPSSLAQGSSDQGEALLDHHGVLRNMAGVSPPFSGDHLVSAAPSNADQAQALEPLSTLDGVASDPSDFDLMDFMDFQQPLFQFPDLPMPSERAGSQSQQETEVARAAPEESEEQSSRPAKGFRRG